MHSDKYEEAEVMKVVLKLADEMGLKAASLEKELSPASAHFVLENTEEVLCCCCQSLKLQFYKFELIEECSNL